MDVHQDVTDGLGGPAISHPGGPQSPARSAESLHKGPRPKTALRDLSQGQVKLVPATAQERGPRAQGKPHSNPLRLGCLAPAAACKPRSPSLFSVDEDEEGEGDEDKHPSPSALSSQAPLRCKSPSASSSGGRLASRMSAPVLNQIHEEDREDEEEAGRDRPKPILSLSLNPNVPSASALGSPPEPAGVTGPVAAFTPTSETSDEERDSHRKPDRGGVCGPEEEAGVRRGGREKRGSGQASPTTCASPGSGQSKAKAASGLVESLKLMSLCLSSQFQSLTGGGGGGSSSGNITVGDTQERPMWRMCMGGSTGSLDKVSLLGGPSSRGNLYQHRPQLGDALADPLLEGPCTGTLRLGELDLARENHRNMKNRVLQMPLSDQTLSVNIHRKPKEGLLCTPTPHSCCQVI